MLRKRCLQRCLSAGNRAPSTLSCLGPGVRRDERICGTTCPARASALPQRPRPPSAADPSPRSPISTFSAASVVPPGEVTWRRSSAASSPVSAIRAAAPAMVARASSRAASGGRPARLAGGLQRLDEGVEIGRRRAGDGGRRVHQVLVGQVDHRADRGEQGVGARRAPRRRSAKTLAVPCPIAAAVVGITRATAPAAERRGDVGRARRRRPPRRSPRRAPDAAATSAAASRQSCGLTASTTVRAAASAARVGIQIARPAASAAAPGVGIADHQVGRRERVRRAASRRSARRPCGPRRGAGSASSSPCTPAQAWPTVSNMQAAIASSGDLPPASRKSKAG